MKYTGFYIDISPDDHIIRSDSDGKEVICRGFSFSVFTDEERTEKFDEFSAAVGFEILSEDMEEAEQFAKDVVSCEDKALRGEPAELTMGGQI